MNPSKVGIIGCGNISNAYFNAGRQFKILDIVACADLDLSRAQAKAKEWDLPKACTPEELLADPEIGIVINLTIPLAHYDVCLAALNAGKNVHVEKPLCVTQAQGNHLMELAASKGLRVGCAPDTFLGGGHQTARKLIDDGVIGEVVAATAFMMGRGHETWHPDPEFYYKPGGGPMFDMGPYYLTALVNMIGPMTRVTGSARISFPERLITSEPKNGTKIKVEVPTHIAGVIDFANGAIGTIITSFDIHGHSLPCIEVHGTEGSMQVPDPNAFGGPVKVKLPGKEWEEVPLTHGYTVNSRGIGAADIAYAIRSGRPHRASGALGNHVLEAMHGFHIASETGSHHRMTTHVDRPAALPVGLPEDELDS